MIVDTSALVAILFEEDDADDYYSQLRASRNTSISASTFVESAIVIDSRRNPVLSRRLDSLLDRVRVNTVDVSAPQAQIARQAYRDYGKGSGHPAQLNFGDCFAYALAKDRDEPLLFKGDDFNHTDVRIAAVRDT